MGEISPVVTVTEIPKETIWDPDFELGIYDQDGRLLLQSIGDSTRLADVELPAGEYDIEVSRYLDVKAGEYTLQVEREDE